MKYFNKIKIYIINNILSQKNRYMNCTTNIYRRTYCGLFSQDEKCPYCNGNKILRCIDCDGFGKVYIGAMKETICSTCNGSGALLCNFCGGSGINHML